MKGALDACSLSSQDFANLKRAVQAEGLERRFDDARFSISQAFFQARTAPSKYTGLWFEFAKPASC
jgi:hypothetical protein